jgi:hypothetical protein
MQARSLPYPGRSFLILIFSKKRSTSMKRPDKDLAFAINAGLQAIVARRAQAEHALPCARERVLQRRADDRKIGDSKRIIRSSDPFYA